MDVPEPAKCEVCDFEFDPYHKVIIVLSVQIGGDGKWYVHSTEAIHAHCWSNHVSLTEKR